VVAGDDRYYNNVFVGKGADTIKYKNQKFGMMVYNKTPDAQKTISHTNLSNRWPIWIDHNVYWNGAQPWDEEKEFLQEAGSDPAMQVLEVDGNVYLQFTTRESLSSVNTKLITTDLLGKTKMSKAFYENPDGTALSIDTDFLGNKRRSAHPTPGPFENPGNGLAKIRVW
jgi:hypothetical protein